jgi:hypothetical protein
MWFGFFMCHLHNEKDESISAWNEYSALSLLNHSSHNHKHVFELEVLFFHWHLHDTFGSRIIKIQTWVISILLHHSKMRENIWSKVENLELYKRTDLSKPQNQKQTFTHTSFLERRWRILSVIIGVAPDCAREGYYIDTRFWSKISKESFITCSTQQFFIAIQFLMKMNEGRIQHHTCKEFVLLLLSKDQMCTHD